MNFPFYICYKQYPYEGHSAPLAIFQDFSAACEWLENDSPDRLEDCIIDEISAEGANKGKTYWCYIHDEPPQWRLAP